jgi:DNA-binding protein H-NS
MSSYIQLATQIEKLKKEAEAARKREVAETIANIKRAIELFGLTADDLGLGRAGKKRGRKAAAKKSTQSAGTGKRRGRPPKSAAAPKAGRKAGRKAAKKRGRKPANMDKRSVVAPKYRDSATGTTWTGRGKQPKWLAAAIKSGKRLEDFKI